MKLTILNLVACVMFLIFSIAVADFHVAIIPWISAIFAWGSLLLMELQYK